MRERERDKERGLGGLGGGLFRDVGGHALLPDSHLLVLSTLPPVQGQVQGQLDFRVNFRVDLISGLISGLRKI